MKKTALVLAISLLLMMCGCGENKNLYLPESENDKIFTIISGRK